MKVNRNLYGSRGSGKSHTSKEIDLRAELSTILYGGDGLLPHAKKILIRKFRLDSNDKKVKCTCFDNGTNEGSTECQFCLGEGFFWDEEWAECFTTYVGAEGGLASKDKFLKPGNINAAYKVFYFDHTVEIRYIDKIVELKLDTEGAPVVPYIRDSIYKPQTIKENRADYGRLEFLEIFCVEKDAIRRKY